MRTATRRGALLAAIAGSALAAPAIVPAVLPSMPDAALVTLCNRWLALADVTHNEAVERWRIGAPCDDAAMARDVEREDEGEAILAEVEDMTPATIAGIVALACVAVRRAYDRGEDADEGEANDPEALAQRLAANDPAFVARLATVRAEREKIRLDTNRRSDAQELERIAEAERHKAEEAARPRTQAELVAAVQRWEVGLEEAAGYLAHCRAGLDAARIAAGIAS
mgnify:CR=1 FL=1